MSVAPPVIGIMQLDHARGLALPFYATEGAAGADICAACPENEPIIIKTSQWGLVPTGLALQIPEGYEVQVRPRSGLAAKSGVTILNAPGTVDWDYRGEVKVILVNHGPEPFLVTRGMRIAQIVVSPVVQARFFAVADAGTTMRGAGGFGSTGTG
jgi:dUTP pyrophosphatase